MDNQMKLMGYVEAKPYRFRRVVWRIVNAFVFPLLGREMRARILRLFGAKTGIHVLVYRSARIFAPWNLEVGSEVCLGPRVEIYNKGKITIGSGVVISQDVYLCTATHDYTSPTFTLKISPIVIGNDCWVAAKATVLPGIAIGEGVVVGACSVVTKDVPSWTIIAGNPARTIGKRELHNA